jgi:hypothetical protein
VIPAPLRRVVLVVAAALTALLATAGPAAAHGADAPDGTDYRTRSTGLSPAEPGVTVRVVEAGARLELTNRTDRDIQVLGYSGEPYLRIGPTGVYENSHSPASYLNRTIDGDTALPPDADPAAAPAWHRVSTDRSVRWHDQRTRWLDPSPPAAVTADPGREQRIRDWTVPLRVGDSTAEIRGTLDWVPPPDAYPWWVAAALGLLTVGAAGLLPAGTRAGDRALRAVGALLALGGTAALALIVGRELDSGAPGLGGLLLGLISGQVWALLTALGALAAGGWALARREAADFAVALAGACLTIFAGFADLAVLSRSVAPVAWPPLTARVLVTVVLATGLGAVAAGLLRLHAAARSAPRPAGQRERAALRGSKP